MSDREAVIDNILLVSAVSLLKVSFRCVASNSKAGVYLFAWPDFKRKMRVPGVQEGRPDTAVMSDGGNSKCPLCS